jgi:hypothetical protein
LGNIYHKKWESVLDIMDVTWKIDIAMPRIVMNPVPNIIHAITNLSAKIKP